MNLIFIYALLYDPSDLYMLHIYIFMYALYIYMLHDTKNV